MLESTTGPSCAHWRTGTDPARLGPSGFCRSRHRPVPRSGFRRLRRGRARQILSAGLRHHSAILAISPVPTVKLLISISGPSGVGKSTLASAVQAQLREELTAAIVCLDGYHRYDRATRLRLGLVPEDPAANDLAAFASDLRRYESGSSVAFRTWDHAAGAVAGTVEVAPAQVLIVDGLHAGLACDAAFTAAVEVFLDAAPADVAEWRIDRDARERGYPSTAGLAENGHRKAAADKYIRPLRGRAHIVIDIAADHEHEARRHHTVTLGRSTHDDSEFVLSLVQAGVTSDA